MLEILVRSIRFRQSTSVKQLVVATCADYAGDRRVGNDLDKKAVFCYMGKDEDFIYQNMIASYATHDGPSMFARFVDLLVVLGRSLAMLKVYICRRFVCRDGKKNPETTDYPATGQWVKA